MQTFTKEDFLSTVKPYEYLRSIKNNPLEHEQALEAIQENAHTVGVRNFRKLYGAFLRSNQISESLPRE